MARPVLPAHQLKIVLVEPEIPQNTGNIARLCVVTGAQLHLVHPLGFVLSDRHLKRAGLDYWTDLNVQIHASWQDLRRQLTPPERWWLLSSKAQRNMWDVEFRAGDWLIFGRETGGLPTPWLAAEPDHQVTIPMRADARCLNLSTAAGIVLYAALAEIGGAPG